MTKPASKKPRINASSCRWLAEIHSHIIRYNIRGRHQFADVAADTLDGGATRAELDDLIRRRMLKIVNYDENNFVSPSVCGSKWSVDLTDRAITTFWPDRLAHENNGKKSHPNKQQAMKGMNNDRR